MPCMCWSEKLSFPQDGVNLVKKMKGVFCFRVKGKGGKEGIWIVDAKNGAGSVSFGGPGGWLDHVHSIRN